MKEKNTKKEECCCENHEHHIKFNTENDLNIAVIKDGKDLLINEDCCTCINIMLKNDGQILTSFLGSHNPYIISQLEQAQKYYFKGLKKALKTQVMEEEYGNGCHCHDEQCGHEHCHCEDDCDDAEEHKYSCGCGENCTCGDDCHCDEENKCNDNCTCNSKNEVKKHAKNNK